MRKTKRSKQYNTSSPAGHPFPCLSHRTHWLLVPAIVLAWSFVWLAPFAEGRGANADKKGASDEFLLFGTVFTEQGFALRAAEIRVRRASERKVRWEARSDSRGEFAVRVPRGAEYEVSIRAAGYQEHSQKVDAREGSREDFVFRLQPVAGGKTK